MKKLLLVFLVALTASFAAHADGLVATLTTGDTFKTYYGVDAFKQAYADATDGSVITLSAGSFNAVSSNGYIEKNIKIIGVGAFGADYTKRTILSTHHVRNTNDVYIEGVYFSSYLYLNNCSNTILKRCELNYLQTYSNAAHTNTLVDECAMHYDYAPVGSANYCIKNSTIGEFGNNNSNSNTATNPATYTNDVIYRVYGSYIPYGVYKNCLIFKNNSADYYSSYTLRYAACEYYNNVIVNDTSHTLAIPASAPQANNTCLAYSNYSKFLNNLTTFPAPELKTDEYKGQDGTVIGTYGGTGFSWWPSVPRVTEQTIDAATDAEGKFNVNIKVQAQQ